MENFGAYLVEKQKFEVRPAPMPKLENPEDVLVRVEYAGICAADQDMFKNGEYGPLVVDFPKIIGHEATGTVIEVGSAVKKLKVGDRVALEPSLPCLKCEQCLKGNYNSCANKEFKGAPPTDGYYQKYVTQHELWAHKLPDSLSSRDGALVEPLAIGMQSAQLGNVTIGDTVVIIGLGTIGLCTLDCCKARGATKIIVVDCSPARMATAEKLGATVLDFTKCDPVKEVERLTDGQLADVVFECSGAESAFLSTVNYVKNAGTVVGVGLNPKETIQIDYRNMMFKGATLKWTNDYANIFPMVVSGLATGLLTTEGIITDEFPVEKVQEAFEFAINNKATAVKTIIKF